MALSDQDKERIREEEAFRQQVREELRRSPDARKKAVVFWIVLLAVAILLFAVVHHTQG